MDNSFDQEELKASQPRGFIIGWHVLDVIEKWLAGIFELTEEEQEDAAVYLDDHRQQ